MANHKSALKRAKQNEKKRLRNKIVKTRVKNTIKEVYLIKTKNLSKEDLISTLNKAKSIIDKASQKGVIHKNNASRKISRLSRYVNNFASL